jgi:hypothetical protein
MASMVATSVNFQIIWDPQVTVAGNVTTLAGANVTLYVYEPRTNYEANFAATVSSDNTYASYVTQQQSDFPVNGTYQLQWLATWPDGTYLLSARIPFNVLPVTPQLGGPL